MWTRWRPKRRWPTTRIRAGRAKSQSRSATGADRWTVGALPGIELPPTFPREAGSWMCRVDKEVGHGLVGGVTVGAGFVIGQAYGVAVWLDPRAVTGTELGEGASIKTGAAAVRLGQLEGELPMSTLLGAWDRMISSMIRPRKMRLAKGYAPSSSAPLKMREGALGSSLLIRRPLRMRW